MSTLAQLEQELTARQDDLNTCNEMLALDPNSTDALETIAILEVDIADIKTQIAAKKAEQRNPAAPPPPPATEDDATPPPPPKYDMSKHPKFRKQSPEAAAAAPPPPPSEETHQQQTVFNVKDLVMAKFSEDKQWYQASIVSKTGSSTDPVYKVTFKGYGNTETKRKHEIRAIVENHKKRKADGAPAAAPQTPASPSRPAPQQREQQNGSVISAAPSVDTTLVQKREPSKVSDGPTRMAPEPKKLKGNRVLEKGKSNWQDFQKAGPKKTGFGAAAASSKPGKDSQFRTPDLPNARVGFTGSGKPMSKDQKRTTWKFGGGGGEE